MKDYDSITAELEAEWNWRITELKKLSNTYNNIEDSNKFVIRKAQILLLYSHFEGFSKFAFLYYIEEINSNDLQIKHLNLTLRAASMHEVFKEYGNINKKGRYFCNNLPEDPKLKQYSRRCEFVDKFYNFLDEIARIPDTIVDTESNLKPEVLNKILFQLGLPIDRFKDFKGDIHKLLQYRNKIAHGSSTDGINSFPYDDILNSIIVIIDQIKTLIRDSLCNNKYLFSPDN